MAIEDSIGTAPATNDVFVNGTPPSSSDEAPFLAARHFALAAGTVSELVTALEDAPHVADLHISGARERGGFFGACWHQRGPHHYRIYDAAHLTLVFFFDAALITFDRPALRRHEGPFLEIVPPQTEISWRCSGPMNYVHVSLRALSAPFRSAPCASDDVVLRRLGATLGEVLRCRDELGRAESVAWSTLISSRVWRLEGTRRPRGRGNEGSEAPLRSMSLAETARVARYVDEHLHERLTVSKLARMTAMSRTKFSQVFKLETGMSPYKFVMSRRVLRTRQLLASSTLSLSAIAQRVGFSSQSHMTSAFRRLIGLTPHEYRRSELAGAESEGLDAELAVGASSPDAA